MTLSMVAREFSDNLSNLSLRQWEILAYRYGLLDGKPLQFHQMPIVKWGYTPEQCEQRLNEALLQLRPMSPLPSERDMEELFTELQAVLEQETFFRTGSSVVPVDQAKDLLVEVLVQKAPT